MQKTTNNKCKYYILTAFLAFALTISLLISLPFKVKAAEPTVYNGIAASQGKDGWFYCYGNEEVYYKLSRREDNLNIWYVPGEQWAELTDYPAEGKSNFHPGDGPDGNKMIKIWQAPADGVADLSLTSVMERDTGSNGINIAIYKRTLVDGAYTAAAEIVCDKTTVMPGNTKTVALESYTIKAGDLYFFSVDNNGSNASDSNSTAVSVIYTKTGSDLDLSLTGIGDSRVIDPEKGFSDKQGENNFYYAYGFQDRYVLMSWGRAWDRHMKWKGPEAYCHIDSLGMHPGNLFAAIKIWVADRDGVVKLEGNFGRDSSDAASDGSGMSIYHNDTLLIGKTLEGSDNASYDVNFTLNVKKGDTVRYVCDSGGNANNVLDGSRFRTEIYYLTGSDVTDTEDLSGYLNACTQEELMGVIKIDENFADLDAFGVGDNKADTGCGSALSGTVAGVSLLSFAGALVIFKRKRRIR